MKEYIKEDLEESTTKYEDPSIYEPIADNLLFFPLSDLIVTPLRNIGLTPNHVTALSTISTLSTIYFLHNQQIEYACTAYFIGYLLDCVDGNMARKYKMGSKLGAAFDMISDQITNLIIFIYLIYTKGYNNWYIPTIIVVGYLCSFAMGISDALLSYNKNQSDNFYKYIYDDFKDEDGLIYKLYLFANKCMYDNYKLYFKTYDEQKLKKYLLLLKEFGPGNANLLGIYILYYYYNH
jgi:hypothetical protein